MNAKDVVLELARIRVAKEISQYELSLRLEKSHSYIHDVEKGKNKLTLEAFLAICEQLEIDPASVFAGN